MSIHPVGHVKLGYKIPRFFSNWKISKTIGNLKNSVIIKKNIEKISHLHTFFLDLTKISELITVPFFDSVMDLMTLVRREKEINDYKCSIFMVSINLKLHKKELSSNFEGRVSFLSLIYL